MTIALFYGGRSCEHDVSIITGIQVGSAIEGHEVVPVYVERSGIFSTVKDFSDITVYKEENKKKRKPVYLKAGEKFLYKGFMRWKKIDCAIICCHGNGGEDGCLQGALRLCGIPFTGSDVLASAEGMNKMSSKILFKSAGLNVVDFLMVTRKEYENDLRGVLERSKTLGSELIVKPVSLGSSIGVNKVNNGRELIVALNLAFEWDNMVMIERAVNNLVEFNCAVLGDSENLVTSLPEKPLSLSDVLTYADQYQRGGFKGKSAHEFPAKIPEKLTKEIRSAAKLAFNAIGASGIARVDFLYDGETLYVNEINTVPGSLALYLFPEYEYAGKKGKGAVIERLISIAKSNRQARERLRFQYVSPTDYSKE